MTARSPDTNLNLSLSGYFIVLHDSEQKTTDQARDGLRNYRHRRRNSSLIGHQATDKQEKGKFLYFRCCVALFWRFFLPRSRLQIIQQPFMNNCAKNVIKIQDNIILIHARIQSEIRIRDDLH